MIKITFPDFLTVLRFILTVPILYFLYENNLQADLFVVILYTIACVSDFFDGYLARRWNQVSNFGKFFDPLADKFLVSSILILMAYHHIIDPWLPIVLINRDLIVSGIRSLAAASGLVIGAKPSGKWKTALQMIIIPIVIVSYHAQQTYLYNISYTLLWASSILSLISGFEYLKQYLSLKK